MDKVGKKREIKYNMKRKNQKGKRKKLRTFSSTRFIRVALKEMVKSNQKSNQKILSEIRQNPSVSIRELQELIGLSESGVKKVLRQLRNDGIIVRVGGAKGGHWEIINKA